MDAISSNAWEFVTVAAFIKPRVASDLIGASE
jgi:hypothetical protein